MSLETATYINQLNPLNPDGSIDLVSTADDHLRLLKSTIQNSFPNITGPVVSNQDDLSVNQLLTDTGTVNAIVVSPNPAWTSYTTGKGFTFKASNTVTSLTPTLKVNSLAPIVILNADGSLPQIKANGYYTVRYDGTNFRLLGQSDNSFVQGDLTIKGSTTDAVITNYNAGDLSLKTANTEKVRITSTGNVGIGTSSPNAKLDVTGGDITVDSNSRKIGYLLGDSSHQGYIQPYDASGFLNLYSTFATGGIRLFTGTSGGTERMRIDDSGKVGIGTSSPTEKLDVYNGLIRVGGSVQGKLLGYSSTNTQILDFGVSTGTGNGNDIGLYNISATGIIGLGTNNSERMRITSTGKVGIGTNAPSEVLDVVGNIKSSGTISANTFNVSTPALGDISTKVATTEFVSLNATRPAISSIIHGGHAAGLILSEGKVYQTNCTNASLIFNYGHSIADIGSNVQGLDSAYQLFIPDDSPVVKIGNGLREYYYALTASGNLYTWGQNTYGGCGVGNTNPVYRPTLAATNVVTVYDNQSMNAGSGNYYNTPKLIVKKTDGYIYGCGYNGYGQLGLGDVLNRSTLTQITSAGTNPKFVGNMGNYYGCLFIQKSDNTIWAAGYNGHGQLGNGNAVDQASLVNVTTNWNNSDNTMIIQDMTGGYGYYDSGSGGAGTTVMFLDNGTSSLVKTCGYGNYGQLGNGSTANITVPATIGSLGRVTSIKSNCNGVLSVYALNTSGNLYGWGYNSQGQLADGTQVQKSSPILMSSNVVSIAITMPTYSYQYYSQVFIKKTDGYVYGSGYNANGELGVGDLTTKYTFTILLLPKSAHNNIKDIGYFCTTGAATTVFAITNNNTLYGWGYNGNNGVIYNYTPNNAIISPLLFQLKRGE